MKYLKEQLEKTLKDNNMKVFSHELNIVGVRNNYNLTDSFEEVLYVWNDKIPFQEFKITTKPGKYWWQNFGKKEGVAALVEGQYLNTWKLGLHKGVYEALIQIKDVIVYRDNNKDSVLDRKITQKGLFGINIHRASHKWLSKFVDKWSAGCQVFADPKEYNVFINILKANHQREYSYTLLNDFLVKKSN